MAAAGPLYPEEEPEAGEEESRDLGFWVVEVLLYRFI